MGINHLEKLLKETLTDHQIFIDVQDILKTDAHNGLASIELKGQWVSVPVDSRMDIVTKAFYKEYYDEVGFGVFRVLIAIGGFLPDGHGLHRAKYCFATLYYNNDCEVITSEFHGDLR